MWWRRRPFDTLIFNILPDLCLSNSALFDSVFVEIENRRGKNLIVGTIYCPPKQNLLEFMEYCQPLIEQVTRGNKLFTTCTIHNTPLLLHPPPLKKKKNLHNHCLQVLLEHEDVLREIKNNAYANFWGG